MTTKKTPSNGTVSIEPVLEPEAVEPFQTTDAAPLPDAPRRASPPPLAAKDSPIVKAALELREKAITQAKADAFELQYEIDQLQKEIERRRETLTAKVVDIKRGLAALAAEQTILDVVG